MATTRAAASKQPATGIRGEVFWGKRAQIGDGSQNRCGFAEADFSREDKPVYERDGFAALADGMHCTGAGERERRSGEIRRAVHSDLPLVRLRRIELHHNEVWQATARRAARPEPRASLHPRAPSAHFGQRRGGAEVELVERLFAGCEWKAGLRFHHNRPDL